MGFRSKAHAHLGPRSSLGQQSFSPSKGLRYLPQGSLTCCSFCQEGSFHPLQVVTSFSWEYSCFTVLCYFLGYNQVNQLCVYIHCISLRSEWLQYVSQILIAPYPFLSTSSAQFLILYLFEWFYSWLWTASSMRPDISVSYSLAGAWHRASMCWLNYRLAWITSHSPFSLPLTYPITHTLVQWRGGLERGRKVGLEKAISEWTLPLLQM